MDALTAELNNMVESCVIRLITEQTDRCAAMVPVIKKTGAMRICADLKQLNTAVRREHHMLPSLKDIAPKLAESKVLLTLDADRKRQPVVDYLHYTIWTLCILQTAIWNFLRPRDIQTQGVDTSSRSGRSRKIMDNILVYGRNREEHDARPELTYFGHLIGSDSIKPDPQRTVLDMFQYLAKFVYDISSVMKPMSDLLKSDVLWSWDKAQ